MKYRTIVADPPWQYEDKNASWVRRDNGDLMPYATMGVSEIAALPVPEMVDRGNGDAFLYLWTTGRYLQDAFGVMSAWGFKYSATLAWCKPSRGFGLGGTFQNNLEFILYGRLGGGLPDVLRVTTYLRNAAHDLGMSPVEVDAAMGTVKMAQLWWLSTTPHRCACPSADNWSRLKRVLQLDDEMVNEVERINAAKGVRRTQVPTRWFEWARSEHSAKPDAFLDMVEQVSPGPYLEMFARRARFGWDYWGDESLGTAEMAEVG